MEGEESESEVGFNSLIINYLLIINIRYKTWPKVVEMRNPNPRSV